MNKNEYAVKAGKSSPIEYRDVIIVGAGISGIDAAYHLQKDCPEKSYIILDNQEKIGGTWSTHTYPGIRSDSDLYTFGYSWKPWGGLPIAKADEILKYLNEAVDENNIRPQIRFNSKVLDASWDSDAALWTLSVENSETGDVKTFQCNFLWMCQGYYRHSAGYMPDYPGRDDFKGPVIHPQTWPEDLDYEGKKVVVIGSGATAATLIPAMADKTGHITMLQRSPTYFSAAPNRNNVTEMLRELDVPEEWVHEITRRKILQEQKLVVERSFNEPEKLKEELLKGARHYLGEDFEMEPHFTPTYRPWRQRLAFVPDGDLFAALREGKASVVTDHIERFTENGILLKSGQELEADIIISATGFNMSVLGDVEFTVDGKALDFANCWAHRGIMFSGIPNMAWVFGYLRTSWTMRADLVSDFVCRLLKHMEEKGVRAVTPELRDEDKNMPEKPFIDDENFNSGYLKRTMHLMPKQGDKNPWIFTQDYNFEKKDIPEADLEDGTLKYA
ncbi:NAD(P)-binding domain-containing protein [Sneathiella sp. P13V-1]|uniref:flavin-containing monooxygenase n=1 Tax=Sneathiella sp. P13V-1 TaxID=2697366 RepID=UPI00187BA7AD|nr:NAD(P)/FAD-dependent oxidoreductase [Sneathiella sp. P13V-1]MBE7638410.1 NAD(P)-binding domain-containing protein [Sneathiella sp. P13V-1]